MIHFNNPEQTQLFDAYSSVLTDSARKYLLENWQSVFRFACLKLMPVGKLSENFSSTTGRPTKELYSMAGLLIVKEFMNWTDNATVEAYRFRIDLHFALNMEPVVHDFSNRSLDRYKKLFIEQDLASEVMSKLTNEIVQLCNINIKEQRLDSTHLFSNMATFGRARMMGVAVKRFLTQVTRFDLQSYEALDDDLQGRYKPSAHKMFADTQKGSKSTKHLCQDIAEDMNTLIKIFGEDKRHNNRDTYKALVKVFEDQCVIIDDKIELKEKTGGDVVQNTSDMDATYDGHKGQGYQVQLTETCSNDNDVQIITSAIPQTAVVSDSASLPAVLEDLVENDLEAEVLLADTSYGSDENVMLAEENYNTEVVSPTSGTSLDFDASKLSIDDFSSDENSEHVNSCPAGYVPTETIIDSSKDKVTVIMPKSACENCPYKGECPVSINSGEYQAEYSPKEKRLAERRREEATDAFRTRYNKRSGIEATNSVIKRKTGLGQLRVRGKQSVFNSILLKITGWNILRAASCPAMLEVVLKRA